MKNSGELCCFTVESLVDWRSCLDFAWFDRNELSPSDNENQRQHTWIRIKSVYFASRSTRVLAYCWNHDSGNTFIDQNHCMLDDLLVRNEKVCVFRMKGWFSRQSFKTYDMIASLKWFIFCWIFQNVKFNEKHQEFCTMDYFCKYARIFKKHFNVFRPIISTRLEWNLIFMYKLSKWNALLCHQRINP